MRTNFPFQSNERYQFWVKLSYKQLTIDSSKQYQHARRRSIIYENWFFPLFFQWSLQQFALFWLLGIHGFSFFFFFFFPFLSFIFSDSFLNFISCMRGIMYFFWDSTNFIHCTKWSVLLNTMFFDSQVRYENKHENIDINGLLRRKCNLLMQPSYKRKKTSKPRFNVLK